MTGTILPPNQLALVRSVAKSAAIMFVWMAIERIYPGRPVSEYEFADMLGVDVRTVQRQLRNLSTAGIALGQGNGKWVLTPNGRGTFFASDTQNVQELQAGEASVSTARLMVESEVKVAGDDKFVAQNVYLEEEESILLNSKEKSSSSDLDNTFCATTETILKFTHLLFGDSVIINATTKARDPKIALAWVCKAYRDRTRLSLPQGLVYTRLMKGELPPVHLRENPFKGLPQDYLEKIGYQPASESEEEDVSETEQVFYAETVDEVVDERASQIWQVVCAELQMEMPRSSFQSYVAHASAMSLVGERLEVAAPNETVREWLEARLQSTIDRMLVGICNNQSVHVQFVV